MVVEDFVIYSQWLSSGIVQFGFIVLTAILLGVFAGYLIAAFRHGPFEAFYVVAQVVGQAVPDFLFTSPRRTIAIARLAIKESLRRKVILVTFGIFCRFVAVWWLVYEYRRGAPRSNLCQLRSLGNADVGPFDGVC